MTFSDKIKVSRELCNLTQQQLADKVGVSKRTIASYESSGAIARSSTMRKLAVALNVSYDYLANDEVTDPKQGIEKIEHIEAVRGRLGDRAALEVDELLERNAALFAECKWRNEPIDMDILQNLLRRSQQIFPHANTVTYVLYSKSGFTSSVKEYSHVNNNLLLYDLTSF